jgi:hypothetical protein
MEAVKQPNQSSKELSFNKKGVNCMVPLESAIYVCIIPLFEYKKIV